MDFDKIIAVRTNKTVYRNGNDCIKVFGSDFRKSDILNEALNQARVEETGLCIPQIKAVTVFYFKCAIVTDFIKGKTLAELMKEHPEKKSEYLELLVDIQRDIHSRTCPLLTKLKDKMNRKISLTDLDATTRYDLHTRLESMPKHSKLCHGDFNPSNVIMGDDGKAYVIDWSHATIGNASADAARTYLLFWLDGDIEGANEYLDLFCKKSGIEKSYVQRWMPIVAASQSVKGKAAEREFLLSWVNVVDYE